MKLSKNLFFVIALITLFVLTSCRSYEDRVITKLNRLSERIDKESKNFDEYDWEEALEDLADIHDEMEDCDFTQEQLREIGRVDGRLTAIIVREGAKALGHEFSDAIISLSTFLKGYQEGAREGFNSNDYTDIKEEIKSALKSIEDDWKE